VTDLISEHLFVGVFLAALIETVFPPIPTLAIFPLAGYIASQSELGLFSVILLGVIGGMGATIGSTVIYIIALKLGRTILIKYFRYARINEKKIKRVEVWFEKHGDKSIFFGRLVPVAREMISIPAGLFKMNVLKFLLYTFLGSCVWSVGTILAGYYFGLAVFERFGI
jgi:membrane protein DedA with SNARE-associated domain